MYEEESGYFFENRSDVVITDDLLARLLTFPNVMITSHQAFLTQEALNNIAKHSRAKVVHILMKRTNKWIELAIDDDGVGFEMADTGFEGDSNGGLGLSSMKERATLSGGSFSLESSVGQGTSIRLFWPF